MEAAIDSNIVMPQKPRPFPDPRPFSPCVLMEKQWLSDQRGDERECDMVIKNPESNLDKQRIWLLERPLKNAIYGEVFLATEVTVEGGRYVELYDKEDNVRQFAVKKMPWYIINEMSKRMLENPLNEIAALSIVSYPGHPNVLQLEAALDDGETVFLITPFVNGGEMFEWVKNNIGLGVEEKTRVMRPLFRQLMEGMVYIHSKGICHADISLENILIDWRGKRLSIIDFGMSFLMPINGDNMRLMSAADGRKAKTSYCSPETARGKDYDGVKVDVFAAGAVLFILLTGCYPFAAPNRRDPYFERLVYYGDVAGVINDLGNQPVGIQAEDLLKRMMARDPQTRPLPHEVLQHPWFTPAESIHS